MLKKTHSLPWIVLFIVLAVYLRISGVGQYSYSEDEAFHMAMASGKNLLEVFHFSLYETHPPLGSFILHGWLELFSSPEFTRGLALLFGIATIPLYYRIGYQLNGRLTGLCTALLISFSYGCIIQSYIVRYYSLFLFFLSVSFYYYLLWREGGKKFPLLLYLVFGLFACLTHFSAILALCVIVLYETLTRGKNQKTGWIIANAILFLTAAFTGMIWHDTNRLANTYFYAPPVPVMDRINETINYPVQVLLYMISSRKLVICTLLLLLAANINNKKLRSFMPLPIIGLVMGIGLFTTGLYSYYQGRHSLWLLPFLVPAAGWIIADSCDWIHRKIHIPKNILIFFTMIILFLDYDPATRFADKTEYDIRQEDFNGFIHYISHLDAKTLIISDRDEAIRITNIYPFLGDGAFSGTTMAVSAPYHDTHIVFNPYYRHIRNGQVLLKTLEEAQANHMLAGIDTLVFMVISPVVDLMLCHELDKQVIALPDNGNEKLNRREGINVPVILLQVSKKDFFTQAAADNGKAHKCLIK